MPVVSVFFQSKSVLRFSVLLYGVLLLAGCANNHPRDPLEPFNRGVYSFNKMLDDAILKPVAEVYDATVPEPVDTGIGNFFSNLDDIIVFANDVFQLKIEQAAQDGGRVLLNTTVGFLGFFDPATEYGLPKHNEDFGQTLGYWGVGSGPYLMLPLFGPSTVRDAPAMLVDKALDPRMHASAPSTRRLLFGVTALDIVDSRASMLGAEKLLDTAAMDEYVFLRDAYLQRRDSFVTDGASAENAISDDELFGDMK